ncbi:MAG: hypothetical protein KAY90_04290 [Arenimonas sp.]|jgi:hypothetical protein|nr:hypothetical protein [Arenimonas sp.]
MGNLKDSAEALQDDLQALIETQAEYYKLRAFKAGMKSVTFLVHAFLLTLFIALAVLFTSLAAALRLGDYLHSDSLGFLIVGGFYAAMSILAYLLRDRIDAPILKKFSSIFFAD